MQLQPAARTKLETRLAELLLSNLAPCDLGDGIEVVHDVEDDVEIEMDCDLDDDHKPATAIAAGPVSDDKPANVVAAAAVPAIEAAPDCELASTTQFVRMYSAPYERIEIEGVDSSTFARSIAAGHVVRASHLERAAHVVGVAHPRTVMRNIETDTAPFSPYEPFDPAR